MNPSDLVRNYLTLRKLIGLIAMALPVALVVSGEIFTNGPLPGSISGYYWLGPPMRDILVGSLCAMGVFLSTYRGYGRDWIAMAIMSASAIGVALFPTGPAPAGIFHGIFAVLLFGTMTFVCLFLFTKSNVKWGSLDANEEFTARKLERNMVYLICGATMAAAMTLVPIVVIWLQAKGDMFVLETVAIEAFGIAWLVKGQAILKDKAEA